VGEGKKDSGLTSTTKKKALKEGKKREKKFEFGAERLGKKGALWKSQLNGCVLEITDL